MYLTRNFKLEEFASPDADYFPIEVINNLNEVAANLQVLRDHLLTNYIVYPAINVNSGWRTEQHNKRVGGVANSKHLLGEAADISINKLTPVQIHTAIEELISDGRMKQGGLGLYDTFVHYDIRGTESRWDYRTKK